MRRIGTASFFALILILVAGIASAYLGLPGERAAGSPPVAFTLIEPGPEPPVGQLQPPGVINLNTIVSAGYLILLENPNSTADPRDPRNWSDVVVFSAVTHKPTCQSFEPASQAALISDAPGHTGMTDADLQQYLGITVADVVAALQSGCAIARIEGSRADGLNVYQPDAATIYNIYSDAIENPTPARPSTWGKLKTIYR